MAHKECRATHLSCLVTFRYRERRSSGVSLASIKRSFGRGPCLLMSRYDDVCNWDKAAKGVTSVEGQKRT